MLTAAVKFNDISCRVYISNVEDTYIISIPVLAFSMQVDEQLTDDEMMEEIIIHLFTLFDENESKTAGKAILTVIRNEQGDNNGYQE